MRTQPIQPKAMRNKNIETILLLTQQGQISRDTAYRALASVVYDDPMPKLPEADGEPVPELIAPVDMLPAVESALSKPTHPIELICCAIATQEGWFDKTMDLPRINDNPGDLDYAGQLGAVQNGRFAHWPTPAQGITGLFRQVWLQVAEGQTLRQIINQWAPASENNTSEYLSNVASWTQLAIDTPILQLIPSLVNLAPIPQK